jgi:uncharacterized protein (TIGR02145 family)
MKNLIRYSIIISLLTGFIIILHSCKKEELPTLSTASITNITSSSATSGGNITSDGGAEVTQRGICWSTNENPTMSDSKTDEGGGTGQFVSNLTDLNAGTTYHVRAYAINSVGTAYGADMTFSTLGGAPECITQPATNISAKGATLNGTVNANHSSATVTFDYGLTTEYGQTITATQSPVVGNSITNVSVAVTGLTEGKTYHFRVRAVNSLGSDEDEDMTFTTSGQAPEATTQSPTNVTTVSATLNGTVNANHASTVVSFDYGTTSAYGSSAPATPSPVSGDNATSVSAAVSGLNTGTTYHFRLKAVSSLGTAYGDDIEFSTLGQKPRVITQPASDVQVTSATLNGLVNANHLNTIFSFEYGLSAGYGSTASPASNQITGSSDVSVSINLTGLTGGTTHHYRVVATNQLGTTYGDDATFTTRATVALSTNAIIEITYNSAIGGGNITSDGGYAITARGVCWSTSTNPTINDDHTIDGAGSGSFTSEIKCLDGETTYYVRAYATNSEGTVYGDQESFTTEPSPIAFNPDLTYGTVMDIDGNCYKTIQIGDQTWMAENLKTSRYNDESPIPNVLDDEEWINLLERSYDPNTYERIYEITGAFCWYNNDSATYDNEYGKLYNFGAAESSKLCPVGWHVPTASELSTLMNPYRLTIEYPNGPDPAGNELMEIGTVHWNDAMGTNETGFTALPGGIRSYNASNNIGVKAFFWSSTRIGEDYGAISFYHPIPFSTDFPPSPLGSGLGMTAGLSIRCIKD